MFASRLAKNYEKFSEDTNIDGFKEMYYAKSTFFKLLWLVLIVFGVGFTAYQCWFSINEYMDSPTNTVVQQLRETPMYPSLLLCYTHWLFWVDWNKIKRLDLNLDRESFLYAMSMSKTIFVDHPMENIEKAQENFENMMQLNNYSVLSDFYLAIARSSPLGVSFENETFAKNLSVQFFGSDLCYIFDVSFDRILSKRGGHSVRLRFNFDYTIQSDFVTELEMNFYRQAAYATQSSWKEKLSLAANESAIFVSPMIEPDGTGNWILPDPNYFQYILRLKATVYKWLSSSDSPCTFDCGIDFGGKFVRNCEQKCDVSLKWNSSVCAKFEEVNIKKTPISQGYSVEIKRKDIVLVSPNYTQTQTLNKYNCSSSVSVLNQIKEENFDYTVCLSSCVTPCEQWIYETSIVTNLRPYQFRNQLPTSTDVEIQYPLSDTIVVMVETPSTTWQKMLSDIGGLLGLWLGTTLISFFQIVYLCCCSDLDEFCSGRELNDFGSTRYLSDKKDAGLNDSFRSQTSNMHTSATK